MEEDIRNPLCLSFAEGHTLAVMFNQGPLIQPTATVGRATYGIWIHVCVGLESASLHAGQTHTVGQRSAVVVMVVLTHPSRGQ